MQQFRLAGWIDLQAVFGTLRLADLIGDAHRRGPDLLHARLGRTAPQCFRRTAAVLAARETRICPAQAQIHRGTEFPRILVETLDRQHRRRRLNGNRQALVARQRGIGQRRGAEGGEERDQRRKTGGQETEARHVTTPFPVRRGGCGCARRAAASAAFPPGRFPRPRSASACRHCPPHRSAHRARPADAAGSRAARRE